MQSGYNGFYSLFWVTKAVAPIHSLGITGIVSYDNEGQMTLQSKEGGLMRHISGSSLLLTLVLFSSTLEAAPSDAIPNATDKSATHNDQMLIHQASLLPSGIWTLRRQKNPRPSARVFLQHKPRKKLKPDSMAFDLNVRR